MMKQYYYVCTTVSFPSLYSKTPIKIMEKTRVGDQTVSSGYSPGKHTYTLYMLMCFEECYSFNLCVSSKY